MTTISLELAKELQSICKEKDIVMTGHGTLSEYIAPAYTLDELLEWIKTANRWVSVEWNVSDKDWVAWCENKARENIYKYDLIPANAVCKLLIHLIKKGWINDSK